MPARDPFMDPERLISRVYSYAAYRLGDGPDAEDVTSEVFERALRYRKSYDPDKAEPDVWLLAIARRCASDVLAARAERADEHVQVESVDPRSVADEVLRRLTVAAAVERLAPRDRALIALRFRADLTAAQIASIVGARTNAIEVALHRALERLRSLLTADEDGVRATSVSGGKGLATSGGISS